MDTTLYRTRWSQVIRARDSASSPEESKRALEELATRYRPAILGAIQRLGVPWEEAEDLCQEFLHRVFIEALITRADQAKGRFRTFMMHLLRTFIVDWRRKQSAEKRGGGRIHSYDADEEGAEELLIDGRLPSEDLSFEMEFARCIYQQVLDSLRADYASRKQEHVFDALLPCILARETDTSREELMLRLQMEDATLRQALSRIRQRFGGRFRERVEEIVEADTEVEDEARHLLRLLLRDMADPGVSQPD